ncbi:MAG TPA: hypothetical protein VFD01_21950 [Candidatus Dormibacteraeota bacterium]|jgi:hypothetical protein|nr:hypothetical protein [Candidatus Dormibacteraeota bacterium]
MADGEQVGEGTDTAILARWTPERGDLSHALWFLTLTLLRRRRGRNHLLLVGLLVVAIVALAPILGIPLAASGMPPSPWSPPSSCCSV